MAVVKTAPDGEHVAVMRTPDGGPGYVLSHCSMAEFEARSEKSRFMRQVSSFRSVRWHPFCYWSGLSFWRSLRD